MPPQTSLNFLFELIPPAKFSFPGEDSITSRESIIRVENSTFAFWRVRIEIASLS